MKKRAIIFLLVTLVVVSFILPALAAAPSENEGENEEAAEPDYEEAEQEAEPASFIILDGVPQFVDYEVRDGTAYVTVCSFVAMLDPQAVVEEEGGVAAVSSARVEEIVDAEGNTANVVQELLSMTVSTHVPYIVANGRYLYAKDSIIMLNDRVAAPVRILAKVFNLDVSYDAEAHAALLVRGQTGSAYIQPGDSYYIGDTLYWLSRIINAESGNQPMDGKIAVGNVVMNRVNNPQFPATIYDVLYQQNQFSPASTGSIKNTPNDDSVVAAKLVMDGAQIVPDALFFARAGVACYASRTRAYVATIGDHAFYA